MKAKRATLETAIREFLSVYPDDQGFEVIAHTLTREMEGGWSVNDAWYMDRHADKASVLLCARGRWEVFKANYIPRARVSEIQDVGYDAAHGISLECQHTAFLDIRPVNS